MAIIGVWLFLYPDPASAPSFHLSHTFWGLGGAGQVMLPGGFKGLPLSFGLSRVRFQVLQVVGVFGFSFYF